MVAWFALDSTSFKDRWACGFLLQVLEPRLVDSEFFELAWCRTHNSLRSVEETGIAINVVQQLHGGLEHEFRLVEYDALPQRVKPCLQILIAQDLGTVAQQFFGPGESTACQ